jgi:hypothetical protein
MSLDGAMVMVCYELLIYLDNYVHYNLRGDKTIITDLVNVAMNNVIL